jgi:hypothetical protein
LDPDSIGSVDLVIKALDPYEIRIGVHPKMLDPDPDPDEMNTDPQPCFSSCLKFFLICEKNYLVWIRWFTSGAQELHSLLTCFLK